jgi:dTMP kinase
MDRDKDGDTGGAPIDTGRYVAFEGAEGAGKSSVVRRVADELAKLGSPVITVREPGGTAVGEAIREILLGDGSPPLPRAEAALFAAARAQLVSEIIVPALRAGSWVLSDRSVYSSLAYQAGGRGLPLDEVRAMNDIAIDGVWPSTVVLLRIDHTTGLERQAIGDRIGSEPLRFHERVTTMFDRLAEEEANRFVVIDASLPLGDVVASVMSSLRDVGPG